MIDKTELRTKVRRARKEFPPEHRDHESAIITRKLLLLHEVIGARGIHVYLAMPTEVDTASFIRSVMSLGKRVVVPWMNPDRTMSASELLAGDLGSISEVGPLRVPQAPTLRPVEPGDWDVVIVPLVAATRAGDRLGNGAGHYDRLLAAHPRPAIGVALSVQILDAVPLEPHDVRLTALITAD
jgi:5-formyltetrahydrofolate cyclo-ligase